MKIKQKFKKVMKINIILLCASLILGLASFAFTVTAKTKYKTLAFDKKIETKQDFAKGKFKNIKLEEKAGGVEASLLSGETGEYVSPVIQALFKATHIGLHWKEELANSALIVAYIRTSNDGENFSKWIKATADRDGGRDGIKEEETFADLIGIGKADFAQAKIEFIPGKEISPKLDSLTFTFINSAEKSKQTTKKLSFAPRSIAGNVGILKTSPSGQKVNVISREEWGADESYRKNAISGNEDWPRSYHGTRKIIIHHTAISDSNGETDLETNKANVRAIYHYHAVTRGWGDIGYNALVDAAGNIYEGRYGAHGESFTRSNPTADQVMVLDVEGAHAASYNSGSFGVAAMGDFTNFEIPDAQLTGLEKVLAFVADSRGINVQGKSDFLRYDGTWHNDLNNVIGHRDVGVTACPGDLLYNKITAIKTDVDSLLPHNIKRFSAKIRNVDISGKNVGLGTINFSWEKFSGAAQYEYALEKVFGTIYDPQPWETAWINKTNTKTTLDLAVSIETGSLDSLSQYVFYVRALDASGAPISTVSHVNFTTKNFGGHGNHNNKKKK